MGPEERVKMKCPVLNAQKPAAEFSGYRASQAQEVSVSWVGRQAMKNLMIRHHYFDFEAAPYYREAYARRMSKGNECTSEFFSLLRFFLLSPQFRWIVDNNSSRRFPVQAGLAVGSETAWGTYFLCSSACLSGTLSCEFGR